MHSKCTYVMFFFFFFLQDLIRPHLISSNHVIFQWKQGAQSLRMKIRNVFKKGLQLFYLHAAACSKITQASVKVENTRLLALVLLSEQQSEYQSKHSTDHSSCNRWYVNVEAHFVKQTNVTTQHVSVVCAFLQKQRFHYKQTQLIGVFFFFLLLKYNISFLSKYSLG